MDRSSYTLHLWIGVATRCCPPRIPYLSSHAAALSPAFDPHAATAATATAQVRLPGPSHVPARQVHFRVWLPVLPLLLQHSRQQQAAGLAALLQAFRKQVGATAMMCVDVTVLRSVDATALGSSAATALRSDDATALRSDCATALGSDAAT